MRLGPRLIAVAGLLALSLLGGGCGRLGFEQVAALALTAGAESEGGAPVVPSSTATPVDPAPGLPVTEPSEQPDASPGPNPTSPSATPSTPAPSVPADNDAGVPVQLDAGAPPTPAELDAAPPTPTVVVPEPVEEAGAPSQPEAGLPPASCDDGLLNQDEAAVDCGGSQCLPCACSYSAPVVLGDPNYAGNQLWAPSLTADRLSLYFAVTVPGVYEQVAISTRPDVNSPFGLGNSLPPEVNAGIEGTPFISPDELSLYFFSRRAGGLGDRDLYVATRATTAEEFVNVRHLVELNSTREEHLPWVSADNLTIYFSSTRGGNGDLYRATRSAPDQAFGTPETVAELNSAAYEGSTSLSADQREVLFTSLRPGGQGGFDLWLARRASTADAFSTPELLTALNTASNDMDARFSPDGTEVYFTSNRNGDVELWRAQRSCP